MTKRKHRQNFKGPLKSALDECGQLTHEEEQAFAIATDTKSKDKLAKHNLRLLYSMATKLSEQTGLPIDDLISAGSVALVRAAQHFKPGKGARFSTYAHKAIRQTLRKYVHENTLVRVPLCAHESLLALGEKEATQILSVRERKELDFLKTAVARRSSPLTTFFRNGDGGYYERAFCLPDNVSDAIDSREKLALVFQEVKRIFNLLPSGGDHDERDKCIFLS